MFADGRSVLAQALSHRYRGMDYNSYYAGGSNTAVADRPGVPRYSVFQESKQEIDSFKWIESERVGYDLGESAVKRWVKDHWRGYLRARWLEHLQGRRFWIELDRGDFGLLSRAFSGEKDLLNHILDKLKAGQENLDVICWASHNQMPCEPVVRILEALDINSRRLLFRFDSSQAERSGSC